MKIDELYALLRRRGVLWPTAEIYGGAQGLYDYGPLGTALKRRIERAWASWFVGRSPDYYLIEPAEIVPEAVVRASGHLENFTDPEITCDACHATFRADTVLEKIRPDGVDGLAPGQIEEVVRANRVRCPKCGSDALSVPQAFNLMFDLPFGVARAERAYLLPETAQASYLAFPRMWEVGRKALPLGVAVIGRAFRNEIAPRQVLFRMRSFTQAELQIFFDPAAPPGKLGPLASEKVPVLRADRRERGEGSTEVVAAGDLVASGLPEFYVDHLVHMLRFLRDVLGYPAERLRFLEKSDKERAFYNRIQFDAEVHLESLGGYKEVAAVHYRGDYDLRRHGEGSGKDLSVARPGADRFVPHVLELTFGVDRNLWALADVHLARDGDRTVWRLPPYLAPVSVGVFPLIAKEQRPFAQRVADELLAAGLDAEYDEASSIGKRYARMDEAGTPFCVTVDGSSVADGPEQGTVTVRSRDTKAQERLRSSELAARFGPAVRPPRPPAT
ncbi:MAG TPA: glycine--tRNA ligase [Thermoplasmata archaeon]|nr:glycine--tRNA ligase [Thermoplasmata archaeon]